MCVVNSTLYDKNQVLSIRLSADGFSFSVFDPSGKQPFLYTSVTVDPSISFTANIKQTLAVNEDLHSENFARTIILLDTPRWTVVPQNVFEEEQAEILYKQCHNITPGEKVLYNVSDCTNSVILFAMEQVAWQLLQELWPGAIVYAAITPIVHHLALKTKNTISSTSRKVYVCQSRRAVDVVVLDHGMPLLLNTYQCRNMADCCYYALNMWKQLELNQETDELYVIGGNPANEELAATLRVFIKNTTVVSPVAEFNRSEVAAYDGVPYDMLTLLHSIRNL